MAGWCHTLMSDLLVSFVLLFFRDSRRNRASKANYSRTNHPDREKPAESTVDEKSDWVIHPSNYLRTRPSSEVKRAIR